MAVTAEASHCCRAAWAGRRSSGEVGQEWAEVGREWAEVGREWAEVGREWAEVGREEVIGAEAAPMPTRTVDCHHVSSVEAVITTSNT